MIIPDNFSKNIAEMAVILVLASGLDLFLKQINYLKSPINSGGVLFGLLSTTGIAINQLSAMPQNKPSIPRVILEAGCVSLITKCRVYHKNSILDAALKISSVLGVQATYLLISSNFSK